MKYVTTGTYTNKGVEQKFNLTTSRMLNEDEMKEGILASDPPVDFLLLTYSIDEQDEQNAQVKPQTK